MAAAGRSADELLCLLHDRLDNDPVTELEVVRGELARITRLRLTHLTRDRGGPMSISTHVLSAVDGVPAEGMELRLERLDGARRRRRPHGDLIGRGVTNGDGRCPALTEALTLDPGGTACASRPEPGSPAAPRRPSIRSSR